MIDNNYIRYIQKELFASRKRIAAWGGRVKQMLREFNDFAVISDTYVYDLE